MSILIHGMEMPKGNSTINVLIYADGTVFTGHVNDSQYSAVSVHTPHGDLVDLNDMVHPNDSMRRMTIDEQLRRTCEGWSADRKQYVVIEAEGETK